MKPLEGSGFLNLFEEPNINNSFKFLKIFKALFAKTNMHYF